MKPRPTGSGRSSGEWSGFRDLRGSAWRAARGRRASGGPEPAPDGVARLDLVVGGGLGGLVPPAERALVHERHPLEGRGGRGARPGAVAEDGEGRAIGPTRTETWTSASRRPGGYAWPRTTTSVPTLCGARSPLVAHAREAWLAVEGVGVLERYLLGRGRERGRRRGWRASPSTRTTSTSAPAASTWTMRSATKGFDCGGPCSGGWGAARAASGTERRNEAPRPSAATFGAALARRDERPRRGRASGRGAAGGGAGRRAGRRAAAAGQGGRRATIPVGMTARCAAEARCTTAGRRAARRRAPGPQAAPDAHGAARTPR